VDGGSRGRGPRTQLRGGDANDDEDGEDGDEGVEDVRNC
jgi:hypothetical protein